MVVCTEQDAVTRLHEESELSHTVRETNESGERNDGEENIGAPSEGSSVSKQTAVKSEINKPKSQLSIIAGSIKTKRKR